MSTIEKLGMGMFFLIVVYLLLANKSVFNDTIKAISAQWANITTALQGR